MSNVQAYELRPAGVDGYSTSEAARVIGVSSRWIARLCDAGKLPYRRTTLGRLINADAVDALAAARRQ